MEKWAEYKRDYLGSTRGNVDSLKWGKRKRMTPHLNKDGYEIVWLRIDGKYEAPLVHRLVATLFLPNPNNLPIVKHKNGDKLDNRVENLEWAPYIGVNVKLTNEQVLYIRNNPDELNTLQLAEKFGVEHHTISAIQLGKTLVKHKNIRPLKNAQKFGAGAKKAA